MNTFNKYQTELEHHQIELPFVHTRMAAPAELKKLIASIDANGQIVPVVVTPHSVLRHFTLIDGYLRIQALKKLNQDKVKIEVWECSEADALILHLASQGKSKLEVFEEAQVLRELQIKYQLTQEQIAKKIGRSQTWVNHRLAFINELSEPVIDAIAQGKISIWSAQRILLPIARAIPEHTKHLLDYLSNHTHPTRELSAFFSHYQKSNKATREKMVMQPELFFKSQQAIKTEIEAKRLRAGPEGQWQYRLSNIANQVKHLEKLIPQLFYDNQEEKINQRLRLPLEHIQDDLNQILITSRRQCHDRQDVATNHYHATPVGQKLPTH